MFRSLHLVKHQQSPNAMTMIQKHPPRGVLSKMYSENMQQI